MKTRVVQDDSDEPSTQKHAVVPAPARGPTNFAARMARWSAHHRKKAIFGWLAFVIVIFAISKVAITQQTIVFETSGPGESGRADTILYEDFKQPAGESILIQNPQLKAGSPAFRAVVKSVIDGVTPLPAVAKVESPFDADNSGQISDDKHSVLVEFEIRGRRMKAADKVDPDRRPVADEVQKATTPASTSGRSARAPTRRSTGAFMDDLKKAGGHLSIPLTLIILLVAFGALVAAGIPLLLGITAVLATFGLVALISQALPMSDSVQRDHPADRARGRRRLHDVLLEAGARRACRGTHRTGRARGRRGHLRPLGAHRRDHR